MFNLNGQTLKICFLLIVGTLCLLLIVLTIGAGFQKIQMPMYEALIGALGVSGLFGSIIQAFIHSNMKPEGEENVKTNNK